MAGRSVVSDDEEEFEVQDDEREQEEDADDLEDGDVGGGGGGGGDDDDEDEDEEGPDEYEKDDFIVDEDEDEDPGEEDRDDDDDERRRKKKRKKKDFQLDEEDLLLLEDANVSVSRKDKKFKRLKKAQGNAETRRSGFSDEDEFAGSGKDRWREEEQVQRPFSDEDGEPVEEIREEYDDRQEEENEENVDDDDMGDFIVSEDELDENGVPTRKQKVKKKKKYGQATGVSSSAIQEAQEIFGDVDDLLSQRRLNLDRTKGLDETAGKLEDQYEPSLISEKYMTEEDDRIREIDIPERIQMSEQSTGSPPTDLSAIKAEATWIRKQLVSAVVPVLGKPSTPGELDTEELEDHIRNFLNFVHVQKLDIPFISMYRKEDIASLLKGAEMVEDRRDESHEDSHGKRPGDGGDKPPLKWHKVLWAVKDLDTKWLHLQRRKGRLLAHYNKTFEEESRRIYDETRLSLNRQLFVSILHMLEEAESDREVDDVDLKFNLHFPPSDVGVDEGGFKRPKRISPYIISNKAGLWEVASKFGCSSEQFGMQISLMSTRVDEPEDRKETPEEVASNFTCAMFGSPQDVLKGARHMAAVEISCEPRVKKYFRSIYLANVEVSTCPTTDGTTIIDPFHQFAGVKWLRKKPLNKFEDSSWLLIQKAEEEKLLQVTVKLPEEILNKLVTDSQEKYLSYGVSRSAQLWNEQRKLILEDAIFNFILPALEKEARLLLTSRSKNRLLMEYGKRLWDKVSVAPFRRRESDSSSDDEVSHRVLACCWGPGKPTTTFVMLDSYGEIVDVLEAGSLCLKPKNAAEDHRKKSDSNKLSKFMTEHQPEVAVVGAVNFSCIRLKDEIYETISEIIETRPRDIGPLMDQMPIKFGDESLPRLYENSHIAKDQIPGQRGIVQRAVALGRYLQNPLAMVASLCGPKKEILSWQLNPLESFLNDDEKYGMVEQIMVDVTNQVGLDLNLAASHEWLFAPLQFISGLGPRKAASLQRSLVRAGVIIIRKDLLTSHGLGRKVFISATGFLRVRRSGVAANQYFDILDDTRIHPESYGLAQEMARDISKAVNDGDDNMEEDDFEMAVESLREKPRNLRAFSVDHYAQDTDRVSKIETLKSIKLELMQGFQDWRKKYEELNSDELFYLISGETADTLGEGRIVQVTVRRVLPQKAICSLESGISGMLTQEYCPDDMRDSDLNVKLREGDVITCKVLSMLKVKYQVTLTCRDTDMRNNTHLNAGILDPYYHEEQNSVQSEQEKARKRKELAAKRFKPRMIVHPRFQNVSADDAMKFLADKDPGESLIRPSARGPSYLTLTLKIYDGVFAHKDIVEGGKDHKDITSLLRIGKTLTIAEDNFEDLDEVMDRYIDPLVGYLKAMLNYRKFRKGTKSEVDEELRAEKAETPNRIVYGFGISHEHPGTFILTYIRSSTPHHEYVGLYPKGFKFRKRTFDDLDKLVGHFQRHINDPLNESIQSVAARVPMRSPAAGSFSGGSNNGWRDRDHSTPRGGRTDRYDHRSSARDGGAHPSGAPRPYEGRDRPNERGRDRGSYGGSRDRSERQDSGYSASKRSSENKEVNSNRANFPGAKVDNAPGEEAFPGGWGGGDSGVRSGTGSAASGTVNGNWTKGVEVSVGDDDNSGW